MSPNELCLSVFMSLCSPFSSNLGGSCDQLNVMSLDRLTSQGIKKTWQLLLLYSGGASLPRKRSESDTILLWGKPTVPTRKCHGRQREREMSSQFLAGLGISAEAPNMSIETILGFRAPEYATWITEEPCSTQTADL